MQRAPIVSFLRTGMACAPILATHLPPPEKSPSVQLPAWATSLRLMFAKAVEE